MAFITDEQLQEIRNKARIEDVISRYLPIEHKGRSLKCVCPFHDDHDPSLSISVDKQIFKCFVCGTGGNVFNFIEKIEETSFKDAVIKVAEMVDYTLSEQQLQTPKVASKFARLYKVLAESIKFTQFQLDSIDGTEAKDYLVKRNISSSIIQKFEIGYLPKERSLHDFLSKKGFSDQEMVQTDLAQLNERGIYDVFFERITIPIHDAEGNPIGFTARTMRNDATAKYINTSETPIYVKGDIVYNYHRAKTSCKKQGSTILVEGPLDLFALVSVGCENTVSTLGTACTKNQLQLFKRLANSLIICYDGDGAGQLATYKTGVLAHQFGLRVFVAKNKSELDPDEILRRHGKDTLLQMVDKPLSWIEFAMQYFKKKYDLSNYEDKKEYAKNVMGEIVRISDVVDKEHFLNTLSNETGFNNQQLKLLVADQVPRYSKDTKKVTTRREKRYEGKVLAQYQIISQILQSQQMFIIFKEELGFLVDNDCQRIIISLLEYYRKNNELEVADFLNYLPDDSLKQIVTEIIANDLFISKADADILRAAIARVKDSLLDKQFSDIKQQLTMTSDMDSQLKIMGEYVEMLKNKKK